MLFLFMSYVGYIDNNSIINLDILGSMPETNRWPHCERILGKWECKRLHYLEMCYIFFYYLISLVSANLTLFHNCQHGFNKLIFFSPRSRILEHTNSPCGLFSPLGQYVAFMNLDLLFYCHSWAKYYVFALLTHSAVITLKP